MDKNRREKLKRKAASYAASVALLVNGAFTDPSNLPDSNRADVLQTPPAYEYVMVAEPEDSDEDLLVEPEEEKKKRSAFMTWYASKKLSTRILISLAFCAVVWLSCGVLFSLIAPSMPLIVSVIMRAVLIAALGIMTYACIGKAVSPDTPLKDLMNWKIILAIVLGACVLSYALKFLFSLPLVHI